MSPAAEQGQIQIVGTQRSRLKWQDPAMKTMVFQQIVGLEWRRGDEWLQKDAMKLLVSRRSTSLTAV
jgi:hypothetical protein